MTNLREAAQMALDALESKYIVNCGAWRVQQDKAIEALRTALAQPELEIESDRPHVEDDGCPTEKAVLQRFWREHQAQPERKLWLWKNFVDGRPEYWAFDNPYPTNLDNGDPQTLGQPCGYAIFKPSRDGSCGRTEEQVLREMKSVTASPQQPEQEPVAWMHIQGNHEDPCFRELTEDEISRGWTQKPLYTAPPQRECAGTAHDRREWQGLTDEEQNQVAWSCGAMSADWLDFASAIEAKLKEKNT